MRSLPFSFPFQASKILSQALVWPGEWGSFAHFWSGHCGTKNDTASFYACRKPLLLQTNNLSKHLSSRVAPAIQRVYDCTLRIWTPWILSVRTDEIAKHDTWNISSQQRLKPWNASGVALSAKWRPWGLSDECVTGTHRNAMITSSESVFDQNRPCCWFPSLLIPE